MKKIITLLTVLLTINNYAWAQSESKTSYIDEMEALGTVSGTAMACGSPKYETFEMLARAILITKAATDKLQRKGMIAYNTAKADAFIAKQRNNLFDCDQINQRFEQQKIFKTVLYADGTIKMYDGKVFHPRRPYDVTMLREDENINRNEALRIYQNGKRKKDAENNAPVVAPKKQPSVNTAVPVRSVAIQSSRANPNENSGIKHISRSY